MFIFSLSSSFLSPSNQLGADLNSPKDEGFTPAYIAACNGHVDTLRLLHELGANLDTPANDGATPAHVSAHQGHVEVCVLS